MQSHQGGLKLSDKLPALIVEVVVKAVKTVVVLVNMTVVELGSVVVEDVTLIAALVEADAEETVLDVVPTLDVAEVAFVVELTVADVDVLA